MATGYFWGGRSTLSGRSSRSHRSSATKSKRREDDKQEEVKKPDADEVRRRRLAYYSASPLERRRIASAASRKQQSRSSESKSGRSKKTDIDRKSKPPRRTTGTSKTAPEIDEGQRRTEDYVYGSAPSPLEPIAEDPDGDGHKGERHNHRRSRLHTSAKRHSHQASLEREVTPADSISQVGVSDESHRDRRSTHDRPSLRRSNTTSSNKWGTWSTILKSERTTVSTKGSSTTGASKISSTTRRHSTTSIPQAPRLVECLTCGSDDVPSNKAAKLACGHCMCHDCLKRVFEMSIKDPAHMPPKCCTDKHIPLEHVAKLFDTPFKILWNRKYQEYHTKNRLYCPKAGCGYWIRPNHIHTDQGRKYATCHKCKTKVCAHCNNKLHKSSDCPKDPEIAKLVEQAKKEGWQRCYSCKSLVEKKEGCNHMTCRCTAEFCIICGAKWKSCDCPWFNYSHLPNPDRLNHMRVPEPVRHIYRQFPAFRAMAGELPDPLLALGLDLNDFPAVRPAAQARPRNGPPPEVRYQEEMDNRRRQERLDADLARRLQLASLLDPDDDGPPARRHRDEDMLGLGNAARHFLNDDFVQNAANVIMNAFGDANLGRRGERASGRRRRPRPAQQNEGEPGLAPDFLGDESVLGAAGPARA